VDWIYEIWSLGGSDNWYPVYGAGGGERLSKVGSFYALWYETLVSII
jgi:hypothetical protein